MEERETAKEESVAAFARRAGCRLALLANLGAAPEVEIGGRRYRLIVERVFRLEELDGEFIYYLRNAGALQRRLARLAAAGDSRREIPSTWCLPGPDN